MPALPNANLLNLGAALASDRDLPQVHQLVKRKNWAAKEPGVILVFCIVGTIAILLISLFIHKKLQARRAAKQ